MNPLSSLPPNASSPEHTSSRPVNVSISQNNDPKDSVVSSLNIPLDRVSLSASSYELSLYLEGLSQIPDVRQARITELQQSLESHSYLVSSENLAKKILQELYTQSHQNRPSAGS